MLLLGIITPIRSVACASNYRADVHGLRRAAGSSTLQLMTKLRTRQRARRHDAFGPAHAHVLKGGGKGRVQVDHGKRLHAGDGEAHQHVQRRAHQQAANDACGRNRQWCVFEFLYMFQHDAL